LKYIIQKNGRYYYNRRIPDLLKAYDKRVFIKISLKTDSKELARRRALIINSRIEQYWDELVTTGRTHEEGYFKKAVRIAQEKGFSYATPIQIASENIEVIKQRVKAADESLPKVVEAVLGGIPTPNIYLNSLLEKFWTYSKERIIDKSATKIKKWENPRKKAVNNFIALVGNKELTQITRDNIIEFRDWWINRIKNEQKNYASANKDLIHLKNILETVSDNLKLGIDIRHLFKKITIRNGVEEIRLPFSSEQILSILESDNLKDLNEDARWFLFAASETGARPAELLGLLPEDIQLNTEVPHIKIIDRKDNRLKTPHSQRDIPLVGYALDAFSACPRGFERYLNKADNLSTFLNKFLREKKLFPSEQHSLYSLRHSFQDRILSVNTPDRIQAELMGHKFKRPRYGEGGTLKHKKNWLDKVCLKDTIKLT
jgi:integrase